LHLAVIVAVASVGVMQMTGDEVIRVVAMRHCFVPATRAVGVAGGVRRALMAACAGVRVGGIDGQAMLVGMPVMNVMQMAVVEIIRVAVMQDGDMAAGRSVRVGFGVWLVCGATGPEQGADGKRSE
jgi:hypothetical protein